MNNQQHTTHKPKTRDSRPTTHDPRQISYLGIPGSFSYQAAKKYFSDQEIYIPCPTVRQVFTSVQEGHTHMGVVPLENSLHGTVVESFDLLSTHHLSLVGEIYLRIHHCILGKKRSKEASSDLRWATRCFSHWQAISQCEPFFLSHPWIKPVFSTDTATAAKDLSESSNETDLAIAGTLSASLYDLDILKEHAEKDAQNFTRFGIVSNIQNEKGEKISISFSVKHEPGSLLKALTPYAKHGLNLMHIESRPKQGSPWEYDFFVDLEIGENVHKASQAISDMREQTHALHILGRYQKGNIYET